MARFIPREKLGKKARRALDAQGRETWPFPPVQRKVESKKRYDRKKSAHAWKKDSGMGASDCQKGRQERPFFDIVKTGEEDAKERSGAAASHRDAVYRHAGTQGAFTAEDRRSNDFGRNYELVEDLYCEDNGRPSCDPVVLFKPVLIQHLSGIRSLRQTIRDAEVKVAYRWFPG